MLARIEYPHWLMLAGAVLVLAGLIGWARNLQAAKKCENPQYLKAINLP
jgi:hypothetical protein